MRNVKQLPFCEGVKQSIKMNYMSSEDTHGVPNLGFSVKCAPKETKCKMVTDTKPGMICMEEYIDGLHMNTMNIMPDFSDIKVIKDQNCMNRAVIVKFADGTETKATLDGCDSYSLEQGISICVAKRLLDDKTFGRHGSAAYNKIIRRALQVMHINEEERQNAAYEHERKEKRYAKLTEKKRKRDERRAAAHREAEIEMRKEAYLRAMRELQKENVE